MCGLALHGGKGADDAVLSAPKSIISGLRTVLKYVCLYSRDAHCMEGRKREMWVWGASSSSRSTLASANTGSEAGTFFRSFRYLAPRTYAPFLCSATKKTAQTSRYHITDCTDSGHKPEFQHQPAKRNPLDFHIRRGFAANAVQRPLKTGR